MSTKIAKINGIMSFIMIIAIRIVTAVTTDSTAIASNFNAKIIPMLISYLIIQYVVIAIVIVVTNNQRVIVVLIALILVLTVTVIINSKVLAR